MPCKICRACPFYVSLSFVSFFIAKQCSLFLKKSISFVPELCYNEFAAPLLHFFNIFLLFRQYASVTIRVRTFRREETHDQNFSRRRRCRTERPRMRGAYGQRVRSCLLRGRRTGFPGISKPTVRYDRQRYHDAAHGRFCARKTAACNGFEIVTVHGLGYKAVLK